MSNFSSHAWNLSGRGFILLFLSNMCRIPFVVYLFAWSRKFAKNSTLPHLKHETHEVGFQVTRKIFTSFYLPSCISRSWSLLFHVVEKIPLRFRSSEIYDPDQRFIYFNEICGILFWTTLKLFLGKIRQGTVQFWYFFHHILAQMSAGLWLLGTKKRNLIHSVIAQLIAE